MKQLLITAIILHLFVIGDAGHTQKQPEEILKTVVKIREVIPDGALTAPLLGTEREGNGFGSRKAGHSVKGMVHSGQGTDDRE
jgi:hypothetical protein